MALMRRPKSDVPELWAVNHSVSHSHVAVRASALALVATALNCRRVARVEATVRQHGDELARQRDDLAVLMEQVHALSARSTELASTVTVLRGAVVEQAGIVSHLAAAVAAARQRQPLWDLALDACAGGAAGLLVTCLPHVPLWGSSWSVRTLRLLQAIGRWLLWWRVFATLRDAARRGSLRSDASTWQVVVASTAAAAAHVRDGKNASTHATRTPAHHTNCV